MLLLSNGFTVGPQNLFQILTLPLQMLFEKQHYAEDPITIYTPIRYVKSRVHQSQSLFWKGKKRRATQSKPHR